MQQNVQVTQGYKSLFLILYIFVLYVDLEQGSEQVIELPGIFEDTNVKAHIVKTQPRPIKPYKQSDGNYKCPEENCEFMVRSVFVSLQNYDLRITILHVHLH